MPDHFERLGLPRRFSVDLAELERLYLARSREAHPDFHTLADHAEREQSLHATAALNEAYLTLKDPLRRAEYLLGLLGGPTAAAHKDMPQIFLMEMLDLREQIENARNSEDTNNRDQLEQVINTRFEELLNAVSRAFDQHSLNEPALMSIRKELNAAKVLRGLLRDLHDLV